jgi:tryptophan synthase alpha chain
MGWLEIEERLEQRRRQGVVGLLPFLTAGFPDIAATMELVPAMEEAGADVIELGVPFSDPLADGVTIQRASFQALQQGMTLEGCLEICSSLRQKGVRVPLVLFGYYNPILAYGIEAFVQRAAAVGVDGFIVADLPGEESALFDQACEALGLCNVPLLAPTSTEERVARACAGARGFVYCVSVTGVTGARSDLPSEVPQLVSLVRRHTSLPIAVGFGISRREHVESLAAYADAVAVGSAIIDVVAAAPPAHRAARLREFLSGLRGAATSAR